LVNTFFTDETCAIYRGRGWDNGQICGNTTLCKNCAPNKPCEIPDKYLVYRLEEVGFLAGEDDMIAELYSRGPITCGIAVPQELEDYDPTA